MTERENSLRKALQGVLDCGHKRTNCELFKCHTEVFDTDFSGQTNNGTQLTKQVTSWQKFEKSLGLSAADVCEPTQNNDRVCVLTTHILFVFSEYNFLSSRKRSLFYISQLLLCKNKPCNAGGNTGHNWKVRHRLDKRYCSSTPDRCAQKMLLRSSHGELLTNKVRQSFLECSQDVIYSTDFQPLRSKTLWGFSLP